MSSVPEPSAALPPLVTRLLDDAAMFPPGNASAAQAITEHLHHRAAWYADAIGPLLVAASRWAEFVQAWRSAGSPDLSVTVVGATQLPVPAPPGLRVVGFETVVAQAQLPARPAGSSLAVEFGRDRWDVPAAVAAAGDPGLVGKYRTGGVVAQAFPTEGDLAEVVHRAAAAGAAMKYTAGLHHAVRFTDPATGFEHHGFLNLLLATALARRGASVDAVAAVLAERDPQVVADAVRGLSQDEIVQVRSGFTSFGCCGVTDPIDDLTALGLLHEDFDD